MNDPIRVTTFTRFWGKIRRSISRSEWAVWLLGLSRTDQKPTEPGLILVQIDGLSQTQFERALEAGRMPFLLSLIEKEKYTRHTLYSGLPSSTPAVQGELHYGARTVVPAFGFRDHRSGKLVRMFASETAQEIEDKLGQSGPGLLQGGSSYCNIYAGGATDVYFCATSFGWSEFFKTVNPFQMALLLLLNVVMFARIAGLMIVEFFLATFDFFRGIVSGKQFWQELIMIPARMVVVILLRELVTIGTCFDSARGQPIIHVNLLGYDEQAHRRGPDSRFAHWTLRGIDNSIRRIWKAAHQGAGREYDVWVFSDHGQESTQPYQLVHGKPIQQVVAELVDGSCPETDGTTPAKGRARLPSRANWLGIGWLVSILFGEQDHDIQSRSQNVQTVTSGPLGFVYLMNKGIRDQRKEFATRLVNEFAVPMTVVADTGVSDTNRSTLTEHGTVDQATVFTADGTFTLPQDAVQIFGPQHPFLDDVANDLVQLVRHEDSGDIVLVGWSQECQSSSFSLQHGAHAGPGIEETRAFALLPPDVLIGDWQKRYLRPNDMRQAAMRFLGRDKSSRIGVAAKPRERVVEHPVEHPVQRILTYNVHACVGMDGQLSPERIARVIAQSGANIVCLQELDVFRRRSGNRDQAHAIAQCLAMRYEFHHAWQLEEERFGNSVLACYPMRVVEAKGLHHHQSDRSRRSALWVEIEIGDGVALQVINTHLSIYPKEQLIQARQLMEEWVQPASLLGPVIVCGDFNARPSSKTWAAFASVLSDVESFDRNPTRATYFSPFPFTRVDHIFVTPDLVAMKTQVVGTRIAKVASDHLPLMADLKHKKDDAGQIRAANGAVC